MKIALTTAIREDITVAADRYVKRVSSNLAPMYLAAFLEKICPNVEVQIKDNLNDFDKFNPDLLGISSVTENFEWAKWLARKAKAKWGCVTVLGGVHITSLPHTLPQEFDYGFCGEAEESFAEFVVLLEKSQLKPEALEKIPGLIYRMDGQIKINPKRAVVPKLDALPMPKREKYIEKMGMPYMMTSRGCPYTCTFCVIPNVSSSYRVLSPEKVVEEIKSIKMHFPHIKHIRFFDDLFIVQRKRIEQIAELIHAENLHQEMSFGCWGRANLLDTSMVKTLQKMNMKYVAFGAESGSSRMMADIKPGSSVDLNQSAINFLYDEGLHPITSILLGHPLETEADLRSTYDFISSNVSKLLQVEFNVAIPWPGTDLWYQAKKLGIVRDTMDFSPLVESAHFPNYSTQGHPFLNRNMTETQFMEIISDFKQLFNIIQNRPESIRASQEMHLDGEIAKLK